ncbi:hypothetical protein [Rhodococcus sp. 11-3]|uniref:DUF7417 domain-containing protein n=1 Tax=Rhodococcus sp. 11-3 TaxID=2854796 RepID=UPI00203D8293|nr:hypothetical protein [Rhodococcus sp. 11-3]USC17062.1 hypothetical protein KZJ41_09420 [Rhodococcus sp. 11-3]
MFAADPANPTVVAAEIIRYENGELTDEETANLFQYLIDNDWIPRLQGHYGRQAYYLVQAGLCSVPPEEG